MYFSGGPHNRNDSMAGSILRYRYLGKLPYMSGDHCPNDGDANGKLEHNVETGGI